MPIPPLTGLPPKAEFSDIVRKVNQLVNELVNTLLNLDSLNVVSLTADHIDAGTIDANVVTIRSDLTGGAYIVIDGTGMRINDGSQDVFTADTNGNVTITGTINALAGIIGGWTIESDKLSGSGIIQGGTIRTEETGERIEIEGNALSTFSSLNFLNGPVWGQGAGSLYGDVSLYDNGTETLRMENQLAGSGYTVKPMNGAALRLGAPGSNTIGQGTWYMPNYNGVLRANGAGSPISAIAGFTGSFTFVTGIDFVAQTYSTRTATVSDGVITSVP